MSEENMLNLSVPQEHYALVKEIAENLKGEAGEVLAEKLPELIKKCKKFTGKSVLRKVESGIHVMDHWQALATGKVVSMDKVDFSGYPNVGTVESISGSKNAGYFTVERWSDFMTMARSLVGVKTKIGKEGVSQLLIDQGHTFTISQALVLYHCFEKGIEGYTDLFETGMANLFFIHNAEGDVFVFKIFKGKPSRISSQSRSASFRILDIMFENKYKKGRRVFSRNMDI